MPLSFYVFSGDQNLIIWNFGKEKKLAESERSDAGEKQQEDLEFLNNLWENKMNLMSLQWINQ